MKRIFWAPRNLWRTAVICGVAWFGQASFVYAGESSTIEIRGSEHSGYSRLVFAGAAQAQHQVNETPNKITIRFENPQNFNLEAGLATSLTRLKNIQISDPKTILIEVEGGQTVRQLQVDQRLMIDLKGHAPSKKAPIAESIERENSGARANDTESAAGKEETGKKPAPENTIENSLGKPAAPIAPIPEASPAAAQQEAMQNDTNIIENVIITIAGTASFSAASFEKSGQLWVVMGQGNVSIPPQVEYSKTAGPATILSRLPTLPQFSRLSPTQVDAADVSVFVMPLPTTLIASNQGLAEGGGLVWKINYNKDAGSHLPTKTSKKANGRNFVRQLMGDTGKKTLLWPAPSLQRTINLTDPRSGEKIMVALVDSARDFNLGTKKFVEFTALPSPIGLALILRADDIETEKTSDGLKITRPNGLALSDERDVAAYAEHEGSQDDASTLENGRVFDFKNWKGDGDPKSVNDTQRLVLSSLMAQTDAKKSENLINLGRLLLSNGLALESRGYFDLAQQFTPQLAENPEFLALQGAAQSLSGNFGVAFSDFALPALQNTPEITAWRSYSLAGLDDWQQAGNLLGDPLPFLGSYPDEVAWPLGLKFAEVALRAGNTPLAQKILGNLDARRTPHTPTAYSSAFLYLKGEMLRQSGDITLAKDLWHTLEGGKDDLYRVKAKLANTMLRYGQKEITVDKAIDTLEGLRYAWRGDELEGNVSFNLGKLYLDKGDPVKALSIMRQATTLVPNSELGKMITANMAKTFKDLYGSDKINKLSPVDALTLYSEFPELMPSGAEGDAISRQLAEHLADADLLSRAIDLMEQQVDRVSGIEGAAIGLRLATLQIQDNKADEALKNLDKADKYLAGISPEDGDIKRRQSALLRAKAYSLLGKADAALQSLSLLPQDEDVLKLRADIAWKAKRWQDAADSLEEIIAHQDISLTRPISEEQAGDILNWAVALYLADNRYVLANLRERYSDAMKQTTKAKEFEVVTRPRQNILLSDRDTINNIIEEADIFAGFMDTMNQGAAKDLKSTLAKGSAPSNKDSTQNEKSTPSSGTTTPDAKDSSRSKDIPEQLKNNPQLKTDEVLSD